VGCGSNVVLDNPRPEVVVFAIDGTDEHEVGPRERKEISLSEGQHKLVVRAGKGDIVGDTSFTIKEGGIIHSGVSSYIVWRQLYGLQDDRKSLLNEDWVMVDSTKFYGDFKIYPRNYLYIEKNWTLGLEEEMPETQVLYVTKDYKVESKVFREADFVETYRKMAENQKKSNH
jgi:hypothetical protein